MSLSRCCASFTSGSLTGPLDAISSWTGYAHGVRLPTHTAHSISLDDQYEEDATTQTVPVIEGSSPVPKGPGLGFEVDEDAVSRLAAQELVERPKHVGILHSSLSGISDEVLVQASFIAARTR